MNMYLTITFVIVCGFYSVLLFVSMPRFKFFDNLAEVYVKDLNCGPFESSSDVSPIEEVGFFPSSSSLITRFLLCIVVIITVFSSLFSLSFNWYTSLEVLNKIKMQKFKEYEIKIRDLQKKLNRMDLKERVLR